MGRPRRVVDLDPVPTRDEVEAAAANHTAHEQDGARPPAAPRLATTYLVATHPDTGLEVVFIPGELLPAWAPPETR